MPSGSATQSGFTYLYVLLLIALIGMGLAGAGTLWRTDAQRAREAELLFVGGQYRQAIRSYYELDPAQPRLPQGVDALLEDNRRPKAVRHLRRAYRDPLTGGDLTLIRTPDGKGIVGVMSPAPGHPFKRAGFLPEDEAFAVATSYADWRFVFTPAAPETRAAQSSQRAPQPLDPAGETASVPNPVRK